MVKLKHLKGMKKSNNWQVNKKLNKCVLIIISVVLLFVAAVFPSSSKNCGNPKESRCQPSYTQSSDRAVANAAAVVFRLHDMPPTKTTSPPTMPSEKQIIFEPPPTF